MPPPESFLPNFRGAYYMLSGYFPFGNNHTRLLIRQPQKYDLLIAGAALSG